MKRLLCILLLSATSAPLNIYSVNMSAEPMFGATPDAVRPNATHPNNVVRPVEVTGARG